MARQQQDIWQQQYEQAHQIPILTTTDPSPSVIDFVETYADNLPSSAQAIDLGCGQGRHTVYLAQQGITTWGVDYIAMAVDVLRERALEQEPYVQPRIHAQVMILDEAWAFADDTFDIALDFFTSINIETFEARCRFRDELIRTLKSGAMFFTVVPSIEDEIEAELIQSRPGAEPNSSLWYETNKFQKSYSEDELRDFYSALTAVNITTISKQATKMGRQYQARTILGTFRKP